ncbi:lipopolysaccharide transport periplasmic protein LptA [Desulforhopalus vacuolatus]|uniref:lipopolysaccharide transport periplasmic protein LptA n=1 Tax=Desulforhopalus vacuolatus TaxID=40414 RepID=UPI0019628A5C|nr:lipopolysaccharide transport periplasmic protein LptA [Desulforhopalus vacuolatus]MBM9520206.1 lipopolysaccharide transport periplasmic protein LptA [Desulforhopalus vacuolatus]
MSIPPFIIRVKPLLQAVLMATLLICSVSFATAKEEKAPINIYADNMISTEKSSSVTFTGNVDATQGDIRIRSDKMVVYYTTDEKTKKSQPADSTGKQQVEKMVCTGKVQVTRGKWLGTAKRMDYLEKQRQVILSDNARVYEGDNSVAGSKIIYYLDEGRTQVIAGRTKEESGGKKAGRVGMTIFQK